MTILKIMCGCPGSGKTTFVKQHASINDLVVSRDEIRSKILLPKEPYFSKEEEIFKLFCKNINDGSFLNRYKTVWADATHLNNASRWKLLNNIYSLRFEKIVFVCMETSFDLCLKRNNQRAGMARVPKDSLKKMYEAYKRPSLNDFLSLDNVEIEIIKENNND